MAEAEAEAEIAVPDGSKHKNGGGGALLGVGTSFLASGRAVRAARSLGVRRSVPAVQRAPLLARVRDVTPRMQRSFVRHRTAGDASSLSAGRAGRRFFGNSAKRRPTKSNLLISSALRPPPSTVRRRPRPPRPPPLPLLLLALMSYPSSVVSSPALGASDRPKPQPPQRSATQPLPKASGPSRPRNNRKGKDLARTNDDALAAARTAVATAKTAVAAAKTAAKTAAAANGDDDGVKLKQHFTLPDADPVVRSLSDPGAQRAQRFAKPPPQDDYGFVSKGAAPPSGSTRTGRRVDRVCR